jgi:hypothetical protein
MGGQVGRRKSRGTHPLFPTRWSAQATMFDYDVTDFLNLQKPCSQKLPEGFQKISVQKISGVSSSAGSIRTAAPQC